MSKVAFNKPGAATSKPATIRANVVEGEVVEPNSGVAVSGTTTYQVPATVPATTPATRPPLFTDDDNIDVREMIIPALKVAQGVGSLGVTYTPGQLILGDDVALTTAPPKKEPVGYVREKVRLVVMGFRALRYVEKVEGDEQGRGEMFDTEAEVYANGGTLAYAEKNEKRLFRPMATAYVLVEKPESLDPDFDGHFPYLDEETGKRYAVAKMNCIGSSFTNFSRPVKSWRAHKLFRTPGDTTKSGSYRNKFIELDVRYMTWDGGRAAFVPCANQPKVETTAGVRSIVEAYVPTAPAAEPAPAA